MGTARYLHGRGGCHGRDGHGGGRVTSIRHVASGFDVAEAVKQLDAHPEVWNLHRQRTDMYGTPHNGVSDVWVRYRPWEQYTGDWPAFHAEHESAWYPCISKLPAVWSLTRKVKRFVGAKTLGGVLVTK